jgi:hypothetical protein
VQQCSPSNINNICPLFTDHVHGFVLVVLGVTGDGYVHRTTYAHRTIKVAGVVPILTIDNNLVMSTGGNDNECCLDERRITCLTSNVLLRWVGGVNVTTSSCVGSILRVSIQQPDQRHPRTCRQQYA